MTKYKITNNTGSSDPAATAPADLDKALHDKFAQMNFDSSLENAAVTNQEPALQNGHCNVEKANGTVLRPLETCHQKHVEGSVSSGHAPLGNGHSCCLRMSEDSLTDIVNSCDVINKSACYVKHSQNCSVSNVYHRSNCSDGCSSNGYGSNSPLGSSELGSENVRSGRGSEMAACLGRRLRSGCSMKMLRRRLPLFGWLPSYTPDAAVADLIAGVTVGLTVIPQAIAYANVADLPPEYGLYSSFMACFIYTVFGSCKDSPIGPTAIAAILTRENLHGLGPEFAVLLCFLSGCVELLMGILQLGFLIDFISGPVSVGFTSAIAIVIATTQIKDLLGLSFPGRKFLEVWQGLFEHVGETRIPDMGLGLVCIVVLFTLRMIKNFLPIGPKDQDKATIIQKAVTKTLWFLSTSRNILVVVICGAMAYYFETQNQYPFILTGHVKAGLPNVTLPPFEANVGNHTYNFIEMTSSISTAFFVVPLLAILENISLAKSFSNGKAIDATQEMVAIGLCNIASSFVGSMPVSGALSRGAVNHDSGVRTPFGGVYTGILVLVSLQYFTPYFYYIPKASLAAVIIAAIVFMVELHVFKPIWKTKKIDLIPAIVTFVSCLLLRIELGIVIGISINLLFLLYASARPSVHVDKAFSTPSGIEYLVITPDRSLVFPSVEYVRGVVSKAGIKQALSRLPVVIDATHIQGADFTAARGIKSLLDDFYSRRQPLIFYNLKPSIVEIFQGVQPREFKSCMCPAGLDIMLKKVTIANTMVLSSTVKT